MKPFIEDPDLTLYCGDALAVLRELEDESVQTCVTSPPYWGLRDYGVDGQVGLEPTPDEFVATMVEIFAEVRRVLRDDGTLWLNLGDSYASSSSYNGAQTIATERGWKQDGDHRPNIYARDAGLKAKDLCMIPARVALALQADGWWLRSEIIWAKPNVMPESVTDRPTRAHEQVYLFAKSERYFFDQDAVREAYVARAQQRFTAIADQPGAAARAEVGGQNPRSQGGDVGIPPPQMETLGDLEGEAPRGPDGRRITHVEAGDGSVQHRSGERWPGMRRSGNKERKYGTDVGTSDMHRNGMGRGIPWEEDGRGRNVRTVWEIATESSKEAHFAIFPRELARRCIAAGTSEGGCCPECGVPFERVVERVVPDDPGRGEGSKLRDAEGLSARASSTAKRQLGGNYQKQLDENPPKMLGWRPGCEHELEPIACNVLDPFMGSGTTAHVARAMARHSIGIELNPDYCALIAKRTQQLSLEG